MEDENVIEAWHYNRDVWEDEDGAVFSTNKEVLISCPQYFTSYVIPNGTKAIHRIDLGIDSPLTQITIPKSVTEIRPNSFTHHRCRIVIHPDNQHFKVLNGVLYDYNITKILHCPKHIYQINIPTTVTEIGDYSFFGCRNLTQIIIPNSVTRIGEKAFCSCHRLPEITIPDTVTLIDDFAFHYCMDLREITIPNSVTRIGCKVFYHCDYLTEITILNPVMEIGDEAFTNCENLSRITIPKRSYSHFAEFTAIKRYFHDNPIMVCSYQSYLPILKEVE